MICPSKTSSSFEQLLATYGVAMTQGDVETVQACFAPDGWYSAFGDVYELKDYPKLIEAAPKGLFMVGPPQLDLDVESGIGSGNQTLLFIDQTNHAMRMGWYSDTYRRTEQGLASRHPVDDLPAPQRHSRCRAPPRSESARTHPEGRSVSEGQRPPAEEIVLYEKDPATKIATITLDRPDELNAMTVDGMHRFADLVDQASVDDDVKVLVIRANGPDLGSGADLAELLDIMAGRSDVTMNHVVRIPDDAGVNYPPKGSYRYGATEHPVLHRPARGHALPAGLQEDQHPRGPRATATAGTSTWPPTPTSSSRPRTRCSGTRRCATPGSPPVSGSGAR